MTTMLLQNGMFVISQNSIGPQVKEQIENFFRLRSFVHEVADKQDMVTMWICVCLFQQLL